MWDLAHALFCLLGLQLLCTFSSMSTMSSNSDCFVDIRNTEREIQRWCLFGRWNENKWNTNIERKIVSLQGGLLSTLLLPMLPKLTFSLRRPLQDSLSPALPQSLQVSPDDKMGRRSEFVSWCYGRSDGRNGLESGTESKDSPGRRGLWGRQGTKSRGGGKDKGLGDGGWWLRCSLLCHVEAVKKKC